MVRFKPLLPFGDTNIITKAIECFRRAGIEEITVVVGHRASELMPVLERLQVRHVFNAEYDQGMFSSIVAGLRTFSPETEAFFLLPADMPLVRSHTVRLLVRAYQKNTADIVYPVFRGRRGHPPLISSRLFPVILAWHNPAGLQQLLEQQQVKAHEVKVLDEGILLDADTPADYNRMTLLRRDIPTLPECYALWDKMNVPDSVILHSKTVAAVARNLAVRLNRAGVVLDADLATVAGELHDVAKGQPDHARVGARLLKKMGCGKVAAVVAQHSDLDFKTGRPLDEAAILYLADKMVKGNRIVTIDERFREPMMKYTADTAVLATVQKRLLTAQTIAKAVEQAVGAGLAEIFTMEGRAGFYERTERWATGE
ncbi:nucleotide-diphospho-sugar transferases [Lucifera butyrica]|uniref:Nucleotide-diphospho-sugar transferases n=2 Tax=Lucifera butyrica TaxID=1351585 RepID=A0A498R7V3_9FIRM|nr:nucleotide-diphospho-sugar transferases [Lucifera butyrica]VBB08796.1 nucleotide-diphospho-sugar transferases [Lucifera butyrica]